MEALMAAFAFCNLVISLAILIYYLLYIFDKSDSTSPIVLTISSIASWVFVAVKPEVVLS
jgi:Na+/melibiose symporter-like transporter